MCIMYMRAYMYVRRHVCGHASMYVHVCNLLTFIGSDFLNKQIKVKKMLIIRADLCHYHLCMHYMSSLETSPKLLKLTWSLLSLCHWIQQGRIQRI